VLGERRLGKPATDAKAVPPEHLGDLAAQHAAGD